MERLKLIGYWREKEQLTKPYNPSRMIQVVDGKAKVVDPDYWRDPSNDKYPWPKDLVNPDFWDLDEQAKVVEYLKSGVGCNYYRGYSHCRLCDDPLSSLERTDGIWIWPDLFEHYIEKHSITIPKDFLDHVKSKDYKIPDLGTLSSVPIDDSFWVTCQGK